MITFEDFIDEIYVILNDEWIATIRDYGSDNYMIVFENGDRIPEHTVDSAKKYCLRNYKEHL